VNNWWSKPHEKLLRMPVLELFTTHEWELEPLYKVNKHDSLRSVVETIVTTGTRRVLIVDKNDHLCSVVTQSRILDFLPSLMKTDRGANRKLKDLQLGSTDIKKIHMNEMAIKAFKLMGTGVTAVAVVNSSDQLVGNLSPSDIRVVGYNLDFWEYLGLSCKDYLAKIREYVTNSEHNVNRFQWLASDDVVCINLNTSLLAAVRILTFFHLHHIFLTDDERHVLGILTIADVLRIMFQQQQSE